MAGEIVHLEFRSGDFTRSAQFYGKLFGWKTQAVPDMDYLTFAAAPGPGGGFVKPDASQSPGCLVYIAVDDIDKTLAQIEAADGRTVVAKHPMGPMGFLAVFVDPDGNTVGLWQAAKAAPAAKAAVGKPAAASADKAPATAGKPPAKVPAKLAAKKRR